MALNYQHVTLRTGENFVEVSIKKMINLARIRGKTNRSFVGLK
jgi:hypothetical protein